MIIECCSKNLEKVIGNEHCYVKVFGKNLAKKLCQRLYEIQASDSLATLKTLPAPRLHSLTGNLKGYWAVDLIYPFRLVLSPVLPDDFDPARPDYSIISKVMLKGVCNYHDSKVEWLCR